VSHQISISVGVANYPIDGKGPIELVELADAALYKAKRTGRNRVCASTDTAMIDYEANLSKLRTREQPT
jgi:PleD family two-component response regulator